MEYIITCIGYPRLLNGIDGNVTFKDGYALIEGSISYASAALSRAAINLLPRHIVVQSIPDHTDDEAAYIITNSLFDIYSDTDRLTEIRGSFASAYHAALYANGRADLLGTVRFTHPQVIDEWRSIALQHSKKLKNGENLSEILELLAVYANAVTSDIPYARISPTRDGYLIIGIDGSIIEDMPPTLEEFSDMAAEDILLSRLINISPQKIDAAEVTDLRLLLLLERIFSDRILT